MENGALNASMRHYNNGKFLTTVMSVRGILFQAYIARARVTEFSLISDTAYVAENAGRILRCMFDIVISRGK